MIDLRHICPRDPEGEFDQTSLGEGFFVISVSENVYDEGLWIFGRGVSQTRCNT